MADKHPQTSTDYKLAASIGWEMAGAVGGGALFGWLVDRYYGTKYGVVIGAILGLVGAMYNVIKLSLKVTAANKPQSKQDPSD